MLKLQGIDFLSIVKIEKKKALKKEFFQRLKVVFVNSLICFFAQTKQKLFQH